MTRKKIRISLLIWDVVAIALIFFSIFMVFETVIKNLLVGAGIHVYNELVAELEKENEDAVVFLEKKSFLPYKESILAITGYLRDLGLHKLGNRDSLVVIASQDSEYGAISATSAGQKSGLDGMDYRKLYMAAAGIADELSAQTFKTLSGTLSEADAEKLGFFYRQENTAGDGGAAAFRLNGFPNLEGVEKIRELTGSLGFKYTDHVEFSANGKDYIGAAGFLTIALKRGLGDAGGERFNPVIVVADTRDDFFFQINNVRNIFLLILGGIVFLVLVIKMANTFKITKEINAISSTIRAESEAIAQKGEIGTVLQDMDLVFAETGTLYDSYGDLSRKLGEVGEIISGIADRDLFVATLKNDKGILDPHEVNMAVLFLDVQGFTGIAETHKEKAMAMINRIWAAVEAPVCRNNGKINKYMGDAALVIFPDTGKNPAGSAIISGLEILESVTGLQKELGVRFNFRIGIDYGNLVYGKTGSDRNFELGVIGDPVNTASRFEALNKQYCTNILVSGEALKAAVMPAEKSTEILPGSGRKHMFFRIDCARPKGKKEAREIYSLLEKTQDQYAFAGAVDQYSGKTAAEYKQILEEILGAIKLWRGDDRREGVKTWGALARRLARLSAEDKFPPAARLLAHLLGNDEMATFDRNAAKWMAQKEIAVRVPDAEWIEYGCVELPK